MTERYRYLLDAWRRERSSADLQTLSEDFLEYMSEYTSRLMEQSKIIERGSIRERIAKRERENAERMLNDLFRIRRKKIVLFEIKGSAIPTTVLVPEEKRFHADLRRLLSSHSERVKSKIVEHTQKTEVVPLVKERGFKVVRFIEALPAIIGINMETYGPFKPEDVASIPTENAENLIRRGIAKEVESST